MRLEICSRSLGLTSVFLSAMVALVGPLLDSPAAAVELVLEPKMRHLRNAEPREWTEFPEQAEAKELTYTFEVTKDFRPQTLRLRHRDLRRDWIVAIDGKELIRIPQGDADATTFWSLPPSKQLPLGKHTLRIFTKDKTADDVMFGELRLDTREKPKLFEAKVEVRVTQKTKPGEERPVAGGLRVTIVDEHGSLMTTDRAPHKDLAIRPGVIYTPHDAIDFNVPPGRYTVYAGRGWEYSVAQKEVDCNPSATTRVDLELEHEVRLKDWIASDPHVHTLTYSGHGDCTLDERIATLGVEGIHLPIATDHNKAIDYLAVRKPGASSGEFEAALHPVVGNEVTTDFGHFNVFPLDPKKPVIDHKGTTWAEIDAAIKVAGGEPIVVLNHARDIHKGFRPFDPSLFIAVAGERTDGWILPANAMEVVNSGSTQNDPWQLFHDWLGLLNRGQSITPIGSSDSHDVARYIVGQGRTYVSTVGPSKSRDEAQLMNNFRLGRVMVGMGLMCDLTVNEYSVPDRPVPKENAYEITSRVFGPTWIDHDETRLYVNGNLWSEAPDVRTIRLNGVINEVRWRLSRLNHDAHVVVIAKGPGVDKPYWPIAKPYQPTSPDWKSYVIGCSGAVKIDADGDGKYSSPYDYAQKLFAESAGDDAKFVAALKDFDEAVAVQAASVARAAGKARFESFLDAVAKQGATQTKTGANKYVAGWRAALVGPTTSGVGAAPLGEKNSAPNIVVCNGL